MPLAEARSFRLRGRVPNPKISIFAPLPLGGLDESLRQQGLVRAFGGFQFRQLPAWGDGQQRVVLRDAPLVRPPAGKLLPKGPKFLLW